MSHQNEAQSIEQGSKAQNAGGAEPIGDRAGDRLRRAPQEILHRERESEHVAAPVVGARHRREKEAERGAWAEG